MQAQSATQRDGDDLSSHSSNSRRRGAFLQWLLTRKYALPLLFVGFFAIVGGIAWGVSAATTTYGLWSDSAVPKTVTVNDSKSVELGVRFRAKAEGYITGIRFYKGAQNTGTHSGSLWDNQGRLLARVTFTNETSNGWQTAKFSKPVSISANTMYVASYFAPKGHYSANSFYFNSTYSHNKLVAPRSNGDNLNGVYMYGDATAFPSQTYQATNYWVDVLFNTKVISPQPAPAAPTAVVATVQDTSVALSWQASTGVNPIDHYNILRGGQQIATSKITSYVDSTTAVGQTYSYQIQAVDTTGATSAASGAVSITLQAPAPTPAPQPGPTPPSGSWPTTEGAGATGSLTNTKGEVILDTEGQVYQNMRVDGSITVTACNVTIKNVEVTTGVAFTGDSTPDVFAIWLRQPENCSATVDHVSILTKSAPDVYATEGIRVAYGGPVTIKNSKIIGTQLGMTVGPGVVQDNYVLLGNNMRGDHNEVLLEDGTSDLTIQHNTFLNPNLQTSAISLFTEFGSNKNILVQDNLLAGGGFTCYCGDGKSDNDGKPARSTNVSFVNNVFWRKYYPNVGYYGEGRAYNSAGGGQWANNVYMTAAGAVTTQLVPQPPIDQ